MLEAPRGPNLVYGRGMSQVEPIGGRPRPGPAPDYLGLIRALHLVAVLLEVMLVRRHSYSGCTAWGSSRAGSVTCVRTRVVDHLDPHGPKPYEILGFGAMAVAKPYKFILVAASHGPKPYEF